MPEDGGRPGTAEPHHQRGEAPEIFAWSGIAITALAIAGLFAFLLALSRIPGIERVVTWPIDFFGKGLVIHVVFSFVVWFLAAFAALAVLAVPEARPRPGISALPLAAPAAAALALPLLFIPALLDRGEPTLNNYIPVIIDPLYYAGLCLLAAAGTVPAVRLLISLRRQDWQRRSPAAVLGASAITYIAALAAFLIAYVPLHGSPPSFGFNEHLMWGGGHLLQFLNTLLAIAAWAMLARGLAGEAWQAPAALTVVAKVLALVGGAAVLVYAVFPPFSGPQMQAFTRLQYALGPGAAVAMIALLRQLPRPLDRRHPAMRCLLLSWLVFAAGGVLGLFVDGGDTRTPAHYHGVIAGVSLALMGVFLLIVLPALQRPAVGARRANWIFGLFGWGQLAACLGLFLAGGHGAPRKVAGAAQGLADLPSLVGMGLNGLGALVAIGGGILFVWTMASAMLTRRTEKRSAAASLTL